MSDTARCHFCCDNRHALCRQLLLSGEPCGCGCALAQAASEAPHGQQRRTFATASTMIGRCGLEHDYAAEFIEKQRFCAVTGTVPVVEVSADELAEYSGYLLDISSEVGAA